MCERGVRKFLRLGPAIAFSGGRENLRRVRIAAGASRTSLRRHNLDRTSALYSNIIAQCQNLMSQRTSIPYTLYTYTLTHFLRPGMKRFMYCLKPVFVNMRVNLCRRNIRMAKHLLDAA